MEEGSGKEDKLYIMKLKIRKGEAHEEEIGRLEEERRRVVYLPASLCRDPNSIFLSHYQSIPRTAPYGARPAPQLN